MTNPVVAAGTQYVKNDGVSTLAGGAVEAQTVAGTFPAATTAGNTIVAFQTLSDYSGVHTDCQVTDTESDTFVLGAQGNTNSGGGAKTLIGYTAKNIHGGADTVTAGFSNSGDIEAWLAMFAVEIANASTTQTPIVQVNVQNGLAAGSNNVNSGAAINLTSSQVPALLVSCCLNTSMNNGDATGTPTQSGSMTLLENIWAWGGTVPAAVVATQLITSAGPVQAVFSQTGPNAEDMVTVAVVVIGNSTGAPSAALAGSVQSANSQSGALNTGIMLSAVLTACGSLSASIGTSAANHFQTTPSGSGGATVSAVVGACGIVTASLASGNTSMVTDVAGFPIAVQGQLCNYASVLLSNSPWYSPGSIYDPNFWEDAQPVPGDTVWFDPTAIVVLPSGAIISAQDPVLAAVCFDPGYGTGYAFGVISLVTSEVSYQQAPCAVSGALTTFSYGFGSASYAPSSVSGTLSTGIALQAALEGDGYVTCDLLNGVAFAASLSSCVVVQAQIAQAAQLVAPVQAIIGVQGSLQASIQLQGAETVPGVVTGSLATGQAWASAEMSPSRVQGALSASITFQGKPLAPVQVAGALSTGIRLNAAQASPGTVSAALATKISLATQERALVQVAGLLRTGVTFTAAELSSVSVAASLSTAARFTAALSAPAVVQALGLNTGTQFAAALTAPSTVDPELTTMQSPIGLYVGDPAMTIGAPFQAQPTFLTFGPTEQDVVTFDFSSVLPAGTVLAGVANFAVENTAGSDATPNDIIAGIGSFDTTLTQVLVPINAANGLVNNDYYVTCTCATTNAEIVLPRFAVIQIRG